MIAQGGLLSAGKMNMVRRPALACIGLMLLLVLPSVHARAELVDRIVAIVNNDVITLSQLNQAVGFNRALGEGTGEHVRDETLQGLITGRLLLEEAARLKFVELGPEDVNGEIEKLKTRLGSDQALDAFLAQQDMTRDDLRRMLGERLLIERFVEKKISLFVRVSRDEAEEFYNRNQDRFKGKKFVEVQKYIMQGLQSQKIDEQLNRYVAELRSKADIRVNR